MSDVFVINNVPGTMTVRHVAFKDAKSKGKAYFASATLDTPLGEFDVRMSNKGLDQFEEGVYQGKFTISKIFMDSRPWRDRIFTSLCAQVVDFQLNNGDLKRIEPEAIPQSDSSPQSGQSDHVENMAQPEMPQEEVPQEEVKSDLPVEQPSKQVDNSDLPSQDGTQSVEASGSDSVLTESDEALFGPEISDLIRTSSPVKFEPESIDRRIFGAQRKRLKELGYEFDYQHTQTWYKK